MFRFGKPGPGLAVVRPTCTIASGVPTSLECAQLGLQALSFGFDRGYLGGAIAVACPADLDVSQEVLGLLELQPAEFRSLVIHRVHAECQSASIGGLSRPLGDKVKISTPDSVTPMECSN